MLDKGIMDSHKKKILVFEKILLSIAWLPRRELRSKTKGNHAADPPPPPLGDDDSREMPPSLPKSTHSPNVPVLLG